MTTGSRNANATTTCDFFLKGMWSRYVNAIGSAHMIISVIVSVTVMMSHRPVWTRSKFVPDVADIGVRVQSIPSCL
jgi:hypothetical protein